MVDRLAHLSGESRLAWCIDSGVLREIWSICCLRSGTCSCDKSRLTSWHQALKHQILNSRLFIAFHLQHGIALYLEGGLAQNIILRKIVNWMRFIFCIHLVMFADLHEFSIVRLLFENLFLELVERVHFEVCLVERVFERARYPSLQVSSRHQGADGHLGGELHTNFIFN